MENLSQELSREADEKWAEFCAAAESADLSLSYDAPTVNALKQVFVFSDFVTKNCTRDPRLADDLVQSGDLFVTYGPDTYGRKLEPLLEGVADEEALMGVLRRFRRREMTRIAFRDLTRNADLRETTGDLSALAETCIEAALNRLYDWHCAKLGTPFGKDDSPQHLVVLGMGKLGAGELNFSSDIDLIFAFPEAGETQGGMRPITNDDFFMRLGRRIIHVLGANTFEGFVFRVDMNLRPYGESGPLVMSFDATEAYYQEQGREWERYAWIKARTVAGDREAGERLLKNLNPFIFRRYLDYGVFESLRDMKQRIAGEVKRKGMAENIKLGAGGIREVEFFGQIFQLIRGGVVPALQERRILRVLELLVREGFITPEICRELRDAYVFLRDTEHRLQEFADAQTHKLPADAPSQARLAASLGFDNWTDFSARLAAYREAVHTHFSKLLGTEREEAPADRTGTPLTDMWQNPADDEESRNRLQAAGYESPGQVLKHMAGFRDELAAQALSSEGRERIDRLMPLILGEAGKSDQPDATLERILNLIRTIRRRTCYVSLLLENPQALAHLIRLANTSTWILNLLARHPVLLDELLDPRTLYVPPERAILEKDLRRRLDRIDPGDLEYQLDVLRIFKQVNTLRVAAADITDAMPLMRVSDYLSDIAETVLNTVLKLCWDHLARKHGIPPCDPMLAPDERGFVVIAYGKLGGLELGYSSDLDMVFIHSGTGGQTDGPRMPVDTTTFFARLGQRVLHMLSTPTSTGRLYEADMRLRPSGSSGILVSHVEGFRDYQLTEAWTWEKQALVRARPIAGDARLMARFEEIRREILAQPRDPAILRQEIREMRERMKKELLRPEPGIFDLKQSDGGIVDIEFLIQYLVLRHACDHPELLEWTDNVRLIRTLLDTGIIDEITAYFLRKAYLAYRAVGHKLSLRELPAKVPSERFGLLREQVRKAWDRYMEEGA